MALSFLLTTADLHLRLARHIYDFRGVEWCDLDPPRPRGERPADDQCTHIIHQLSEHLGRAAFILYQRVTLGVSLQPDRNAQSLHFCQIFHPQFAESTQQQLTMDFVEYIFPDRFDEHSPCRLAES